MRFEYIKEKRWIRLLFFAFCAVVFLLAAFVIAHCDSFTTGIWFPTSTNSDEVIYNRQLVGVLKVGSPQGYFGYQESTADIGRYGNRDLLYLGTAGDLAVCHPGLFVWGRV